MSGANLSKGWGSVERAASSSGAATAFGSSGHWGRGSGAGRSAGGRLAHNLDQPRELPEPDREPPEGAPRPPPGAPVPGERKYTVVPYVTQ
jgi:hypothetical protein